MQKNQQNQGETVQKEFATVMFWGGVIAGVGLTLVVGIYFPRVFGMACG